MKKRDLPPDGSVDAGLMLLFHATPRGVERTQGEIAEACGCSLQNIQRIEYRAIRKIKAELERRGISESVL